MTPVDIVTLLRRSRLRVGNEDALQLSIEETLNAAGAAFKREHRLSAADRIDFILGSVGLEAKTRCNKRVIYRQLERCAGHGTWSVFTVIPNSI